MVLIFYMNNIEPSLNSWELPSRIILYGDDSNFQLRELVLEDAPYLFDLIDSDRVHLSQHGDHTADKYRTAEDVYNSILNPNNPEKIRFGIWSNEQMVGSYNITMLYSGARKAELGAWIGSQHTGNGYVGQAGKLARTFAFENLGIDEVYCLVAYGNTASRRALIKAGYEYVGADAGKWMFIHRNPRLLD
jgi:RimJ/RimL family protein N-acetyltransferase